jgi:hypothetical protein
LSGQPFWFSASNWFFVRGPAILHVERHEPLVRIQQAVDHEAAGSCQGADDPLKRDAAPDRERIEPEDGIRRRRTAAPETKRAAGVPGPPSGAE